MEAMLAEAAAALIEGARSATGNAGELMSGVLNAIIPFVVGLGVLSASVGRGRLQGELMSSVVLIVVCIYGLNHIPYFLDLSVEQAGAIAGAAGAQVGAEPWHIYGAGERVLGRAVEHAESISNYVSWSGLSLMPLAVFVGGLAVFFAFLAISIYAAFAFFEFWVGGLLLGPMVALLPLVGFSGAGYSPLSFLISATLRLAGFALVGAFAAANVERFMIPDAGEPITLLGVGIAFFFGILLLFSAPALNRLLSGVVGVRPGWTPFGTSAAVVGGVLTAGGFIASAGKASVAAVTSARQSGGAEGGGGGAGGGAGRASGGRGDGELHQRSRPVTARG